MVCEFVRIHCYKVLLTALALMVAIQYGFSVLYEESRRIGEIYFTFNVTLPVYLNSSDNSTDFAISTNLTLMALQSSNSSDPFPLMFLHSGDSRNSSTISSLCPLISPLLVGRSNVSKMAIPLEEIEGKYKSIVQPGGRFRPSNCKSRYKVAIVIPYRNREEHLRLFLQHMHPFLQRQQLDYGIFVVEQSGTTPFNRAMLMNIGAAEALRQDSFQCFIFHDVDLLPEDDRNVYSCPEQPRHMSVAIDVFKYKLPYESLFGGVSAMSNEHFVKVNGFSNLFWGWGGEDDDMSNRIRFHKLIISRYPATIARYNMLSHKKAQPNPNRYRVMRNGARRSKVDGLSSLKYKRLDLELKPLYTWILVDIKPS